MLQKNQLHFFFGLLLLVGTLAFFIALPYLQAIVLAAAFAVATYKPYEYLVRKLRYRSVAAIIVIALLGIIIFIPLFLVGQQVIKEAAGLYGRISEEGIQNLRENPVVSRLLERLSPDTLSKPQDVLRSGLDWVLASAGVLFSGTIGVLVNAMLCIFALFYFLRDGHNLKQWILAFSPLPNRYDAAILERLTNTVNSLIHGYLVIAILQGVLAGTAFAIFGVPNAALWGSLAAIMSLIPAIGTTFIFVPSILYLILSGHPAAGLGLWAWWLGTIATVDNILTPRLVNRGARIHQFAVFIAVLGGITFFGPIGFFIGPLVFSLFFGLLDIYISFNRGADLPEEEPIPVGRSARIAKAKKVA